MFGVCHIKSTFNNTFIHVTDLSGRETYSRISGGMKVKADREESSPYAAMLAAVDVCRELQAVGCNAVHIKIRGQGGVMAKTPGSPPARSSGAKYIPLENPNETGALWAGHHRHQNAKVGDKRVQIVQRHRQPSQQGANRPIPPENPRWLKFYP